ncbi:MAG TPA: hypothetical protein VEX36_07955 [Thermoleophilaceae bacterium]|nr:hypothetical protein [Thermoleophilaceae bacterium]
MAALVAVLVLALGAAACGDDDGDSDGDGGGNAAAQTQSEDKLDPASFDNSPEGQVEAAHAEFINVFYSKDAERICALSSRKAQREWKAKLDSCEAGVDAFFKGISSLAKDKPRIVKVRISGNRALAQTRVKGSQVYPAPFVKEDGKWKVDGGGAAGT